MLLRTPSTRTARNCAHVVRALFSFQVPSSPRGLLPQVPSTSSLSDVAAPSTQCKTDSLCLRAASRARTFESVIQIVIGIALGLPHQQKTWYTWPLTKSERGGQAVTLTNCVLQRRKPNGDGLNATVPDIYTGGYEPSKQVPT